MSTPYAPPAPVRDAPLAAEELECRLRCPISFANGTDTRTPSMYVGPRWPWLLPKVNR